jgi:hypothetical protein
MPHFSTTPTTQYNHMPTSSSETNINSLNNKQTNMNNERKYTQTQSAPQSRTASKTLLNSNEQTNMTNGTDQPNMNNQTNMNGTNQVQSNMNNGNQTNMSGANQTNINTQPQSLFRSNSLLTRARGKAFMKVPTEKKQYEILYPELRIERQLSQGHYGTQTYKNKDK